MLANVPGTVKAIQEQLKLILTIAEQPETQLNTNQPKIGVLFDAFGNLFGQGDEKQPGITESSIGSLDFVQSVK